LKFWRAWQVQNQIGYFKIRACLLGSGIFTDILFFPEYKAFKKPDDERFKELQLPKQGSIYNQQTIIKWQGQYHKS